MLAVAAFDAAYSSWSQSPSPAASTGLAPASLRAADDALPWMPFVQVREGSFGIGVARAF